MKTQTQKNKRMTWLPLVLATQLLFSAPIWAADKAQTPEEAVDQLIEISDSLKSLTDYAERIDLGRIMILQRKVTDAKAALEKNPVHMTTLASFQDMVLTFRYSEAFMKSISTKCTEPTIQNIKKNVDAIIKSRGFDEANTSSFVANFLGQLHNLTAQMKGQSLPPALEEWFAKDLNVPLADALAFAKVRGDRPATFERANEIYVLVKAKYSAFEKINSRSKAYDMLTELMGLMELYNEMATRGARNNQG